MIELMKRRFLLSEGFFSYENSHSLNAIHLGWSEMTTSAKSQA